MTVNINSYKLEDLNYLEDLQTSLLVSKFPINENVHKIDLKVELENLEDDYIDEIDINESY